MCEKKSKIVIIGGGIGGLFTGAFLCKEGYDVTVVEKNSSIGGGLQSYCRHGEVFDTGMHVIGGMSPGKNMHKICKYLGLLDKIQVKAVDDHCTDSVFIASDRATYHIAKGREGFIDSLSSYFPHQRAAIEAYVDAMLAMAQELDLFNLRIPHCRAEELNPDIFLPVDEFIARYITDERLRTVLAFPNMFYAGEGGTTPALVHAIISVLYLNGSVRFVDGTGHFAQALGEVIRQHGGSIITGDAVTAIGVKNRQITHCTTSSGMSITGDCYISAIHPSSLIHLLEDEHALPNAYRQRLENMPNTYSALILNIKLKRDTIEYFNHTGHYFSCDGDAWKHPAQVSQWPNICLYMTPSTSKGAKYASTMNIIAPMAWEEVARWECTTTGRRGPEYVAWKEQKARRVIECMEQVFPHLADCIEQIDISSPLTIRDFYGVKHGALYGYKNECSNYALPRVPIRTKIGNLLFTGQNHNLHGMCGVALTAIETCGKVMGSNTVLEKINNEQA